MLEIKFTGALSVTVTGSYAGDKSLGGLVALVHQVAPEGQEVPARHAGRFGIGGDHVHVFPAPPRVCG